jgi:tetratricopeptide (TPR) repeat protein
MTQEKRSTSFQWPELPPEGTSRSDKRLILGLVVTLLYLGPLVLLHMYVGQFIPNEGMRKLAALPVLFFGGLSIVLLCSFYPLIVITCYRQWLLKLAEAAARLGLFVIGNFCPQSDETAMMQGLLSEIMRVQGRFSDAEQFARDGIITILGREQLMKTYESATTNGEYAGKVSKEFLKEAKPTKALLYDAFGCALRCQGMLKESIEAGKRALQSIEETMNQAAANCGTNLITDDGLLIRMAEDSTQRLNKQLGPAIQIALAGVCYELAYSYNLNKQYAEAYVLLKRARQIRENNPGQGDSHGLSDVLTATSRAVLGLGEIEKAVTLAQKSLDSLGDCRQVLPQLSKARALHALGLAEKARGNQEKARECASQAKHIRQRWLSAQDPELIECCV